MALRSATLQTRPRLLSQPGYTGGDAAGAFVLLVATHTRPVKLVSWSLTLRDPAGVAQIAVVRFPGSLPDPYVGDVMTITDYQYDDDDISGVVGVYAYGCPSTTVDILERHFVSSPGSIDRAYMPGREPSSAGGGFIGLAIPADAPKACWIYRPSLTIESV